jgi:hypothetical protein
MKDLDYLFALAHRVFCLHLGKVDTLKPRMDAPNYKNNAKLATRYFELAIWVI